jgi:DNA-binding Lrp family transcriptional regulator
MATDLGMTRNERLVLESLVENARVSDTEVAARLRITPQAVHKLRRKLERGHILAYRAVVDYQRVGVTVFAVAQMKVLDRSALSDKHIIGAFEINEADITHVLIMGFSSLEELDEYKLRLAPRAEIRRMNVVSRKGMLRNSPVELLRDRLRG